MDAARALLTSFHPRHRQGDLAVGQLAQEGVQRQRREIVVACPVERNNHLSVVLGHQQGCGVHYRVLAIFG